ncbi:DUF3023 domain-containing protein [Ehrlichia chaffeensis]|uniref:DUF3023 domain-containing protein n=1 Tax=Ehrlichia chaffeensis TaxID=945 RepID=UPI000444AFDB|nr:DUF3023 domain-containing protein [Ehrlichia chaffeensis]AHX09473.1 hypothetical protein ECHWAK_0434 [Ehrlichia chaffeensis str. Wakulla]
MFSNKSLEDLISCNSVLCAKITSLLKLQVKECYLIGTNGPRGKLLVRVTKTQENLSLGVGVDLGKNLFLIKCRIPRSVVMQDRELRSLVGGPVILKRYVKLNLYFMAKAECFSDFFYNIWKQVVEYDGYKDVFNFCSYGKLVFVRVRGGDSDKHFNEYQALKNIAQLNADFLLEEEKGLLSRKKVQKLIESVDNSDDSSLGAVGGALRVVPSFQQSKHRILKSRECESRDNMIQYLEDLSIQLEAMISKDEVITYLKNISVQFENMISRDDELCGLK